MKKSHVWRGLSRLFLVQAALLAIIAGVLALFCDLRVTKSWIMGGSVCLIPQAMFAAMLFYYTGAQKAKKIAKCFYVGEAVKMIATVLLFGSIFMWFDIVPSALFMSFILMQGVMWLSPWIVKDGFK